MPFQYILANLLAQNDGAIGALFLDESGETIDLACADLTPFQLRIVGAYVGIYLRQMERVMGDSWPPPLPLPPPPPPAAASRDEEEWAERGVRGDAGC